MTRTFALLCLLAAAVAAESMTLTFKSGKKKSYTLVKADDDALTVMQGGAESTIPWAELTRESAYEARRKLTSYDDPTQRLALSDFARKLNLFPEALEQLEIALALGGLDEASFEKRAAAIEADEVTYLTASVDQLLKTGAEPAVCLAAIKRLKERYPEHPANVRYEPHVKALVEKLAEKAEQEQEAEQQQAEDAALAGLRKEIEKLNLRKVKALDTAAKLHEEGKEAAEKRQVSRVKKRLVEPMGAEKYYKRARSYLREMVRRDKQFRIVTRDGVQKEYDDITLKLIDCYLHVARTLLTQRNYKGAVPYVRKILLYDPIHEEALEMVETIRKNRISIKVSDITNARPRVTGG